MTSTNEPTTHGDYELYCNDKLIGCVDTPEKAVSWLDKMTAIDVDQEYTWSITKTERGK